MHTHTGRSSMKQYLPMKPVKRGFKVWVRADAVTGYFCDFNVYTGRPSSADGEEQSELGLGERVVLELTECLRGGNYQIYCDNFFSTCRLFDTLLSHKLYACGTASTTRREFPETLKQVRLERGEHLFCQRGNLVASAWMDKKPVTVLSTLAQADVTHTAQRRVRDGSRVSVQCPDAVVLYNRYMAGVDKGDQYRQYYRIRTKCVKYYKYLFWFAIDASITNSFILSLFSPTTMLLTHQRQKSFRLTLAEQLVGSYNSRKQLGRPQSSQAHAPLTMASPSTSSCRTPLHLPSRLQGRRRCAYCAECRQPPRRRDVLWCCKACTFEPPLCLTGTEDGSDCFSLWHHHLL